MVSKMKTDAAKAEKSWQERLGEGELAAEPQEFVPTPELTEAMSRALNAEKKAHVLEIRSMLLERELYLAKARILEFEIEKLKE